MIWPTFDPPPAVAFIDVDGTLLAETTTYLFARILRRRGMLKRSFILRAMYHGLQHRFGRLDYGRLVAFGLRSIAKIPVIIRALTTGQGESDGMSRTSSRFASSTVLAGVSCPSSSTISPRSSLRTSSRRSSTSHIGYALVTVGITE